MAKPGKGPRSRASASLAACGLALRRAPSPGRPPRAPPGASYGTPRRTSRSAQPITPRPIFRLRRETSAICGSGQAFTVEHVVEEAHAVAHAGGQPRPVDPPAALEPRQVHRAEGARLEGQERLLAAGVHRLEAAQVRRGVRAPPPGPGTPARARPTPRPRRRSARAGRGRPPRAPQRASAGGGASSGAPRAAASKSASGAATEMLKFSSPAARFASTNSSTSGWSAREHRHVGAAPHPALLDDLGGGVVDPHERQRAAGHAVGGLHHVAARAEAREREAGAAARLVDERGPLERVEDARRGRPRPAGRSRRRADRACGRRS